MNENQPRTAPLFGVLPWIVVRYLFWGLLIGGLVCGMFVMVLWLQGYGTGSTNTLGIGTTVAPPTNEFGQRRFSKLERRQLIRYGLQQIDHQTNRIWVDIGEWEKEARAWHSEFQELLDSDTGTRLSEDSWILRYFWRQSTKKLPDPSMIGDMRKDLNTLVLSVVEALANEDTAYPASQELRDRIDLIEGKTRTAKETYNAHRRLLDAFVGMVEKDDSMDEKTMRQRVTELDQKYILARFGYSSLSEEDLPSTLVEETPRPTLTRPKTVNPNDSLESAYERANPKPGAEHEYGRPTSIRDTFRNSHTSQRRLGPD